MSEISKKIDVFTVLSTIQYNACVTSRVKLFTKYEDAKVYFDLEKNDKNNYDFFDEQDSWESEINGILYFAVGNDEDIGGYFELALGKQTIEV